MTKAEVLGRGRGDAPPGAAVNDGVKFRIKCPTAWYTALWNKNCCDLQVNTRSTSDMIKSSFCFCSAVALTNCWHRTCCDIETISSKKSLLFCLLLRKKKNCAGHLLEMVIFSQGVSGSDTLLTPHSRKKAIPDLFLPIFVCLLHWGRKSI